jgi:hypothetical protein
MRAEHADRVVLPGSYVAQNHFYPRVPNAHLHPLVRSFLHLGNDRIADRYVHLHPNARPEAVRAALATRTRYLQWAGCDLFLTATDRGERGFVVVETNSSPSGQKSMPLVDEEADCGGYTTLLERTFLPALANKRLPKGDLGVLWDKNWMEASAYAAVLADLTQEPVRLVRVTPKNANVRVREGVVEVRQDEAWHALRAVFRYVTQRPWSHLTPITRTFVLNPVVACLAGGRNKLLAAKAYANFNATHHADGLCVRVPPTEVSVPKGEVPMQVARMGGVAVVKVPYSNAGQGVYTITSPDELDAFMAADHPYDQFIVQALIGNKRWSSRTDRGRLYHVGMVPDAKRRIYVADLRFMVGVGEQGFYPVALYARRAREPLTEELSQGQSSWDMLGTNLSKREADGSWGTEPDRLVLVDSRDFNKLGVGLDDLIEAYLQTVYAVLAIDDLAATFVSAKGTFRRKLFAQLDPDPALLAEITG